MPATSQEMVRLIRLLLDQVVAPDCVQDVVWEDGTKITDTEFRDVFALATYEMRLRRQRRPVAQRRAMRLLRRHLSARQRQDLRAMRYFYVQAVSGKVYRILPRAGVTEEVRRHRTRFFTIASFCLHDEEDGEQMPPADVALGHLLLLSCDEAAFLATANRREHRCDMWNGEYLRRMRAARLERRRLAAEQSAV